MSLIFIEYIIPIFSIFMTPPTSCPISGRISNATP
jgi:hypothetical protein